VIEARKSLLENRDKESPSAMQHPFGDKKRSLLSLLYIPMFRGRRLSVCCLCKVICRICTKNPIFASSRVSPTLRPLRWRKRVIRGTISKSIQLQNRNKELDDFTYVVSHDLKRTVDNSRRLQPGASQRSHPRKERRGIGLFIRYSIVFKDERTYRRPARSLRVSRFSELTEMVSLNDVLNEVLDDLKFSYRKNTSL